MATRQIGREQQPLDQVPRDLLDLYLIQIGEYDLLTPERELELAFSMRRGEQAAEELQALGKEASEEDRAPLEEEIRRGLLDRETFINSNLRLVVSIAKRFLGRGYDMPDLIQMGNDGLLRAVRKFDPTLGFKFSTYANRWIRSAISRGIGVGHKPIYLPNHLVGGWLALEEAKLTLGKSMIDREVIEEAQIESIDEKTARQLENVFAAFSLDLHNEAADGEFRESLASRARVFEEVLPAMEAIAQQMNNGGTLSKLLERLSRVGLASGSKVVDGKLAAQVVVMRNGFEGTAGTLSYVKVAERTGYSTHTVKRAYEYGIQKLIEFAEEAGLKEEDFDL